MSAISLVGQFILFGIQIVGYCDARFQGKMVILNTKLVWYSDCHCSLDLISQYIEKNKTDKILGYSNDLITGHLNTGFIQMTWLFKNQTNREKGLMPIDYQFGILMDW
jgi:hypothetical protein